MQHFLSSDVSSKLVFDYLLNNGDHSINDIVAAIGHSAPTVSKCISKLMDKGLVKAIGRIKNGKGRIPLVYGIDVETVSFLGVDTKTNMTSIGITTARGEIIKKTDYPLVYENSAHALARLIETVNTFLNEDPDAREHIVFANFNISGRVNSEIGYSYSLFNSEDDSRPLAETLTEGIGIPCSIENDTRAMAICENALGAGRQFSTYIFINASSGIGMSLISEGRVFRGRDGYAGELGHTNMYNNNIICQCGKKGCMETEVSGRAICRKLEERVARGDRTILASRIKSGTPLSENDIIDAAAREDPLVIDLLGKAGDELGKVLANLINIFNPEAIIIGGFLAQTGKYLLEPMLYGVTKYSLSKLSKNVTIRYSDIQDSGILGAGLIACSKYFNL